MSTVAASCPAHAGSGRGNGHQCAGPRGNLRPPDSEARRAELTVYAGARGLPDRQCLHEPAGCRWRWGGAYSPPWCATCRPGPDPGPIYDWNARDSLISLYMPRGEGKKVILGLDGTHIVMTQEEYLALEAAVSAPDAAPILAELGALYGDL